MKAVTPSLLALSLLAAAGFAQAAPNCTIKMSSNDAMQFDLKTATVSASCASITIQFAHTGKLPVTAMRHNCVTSAPKCIAAISAAGMKPGAAAGYLPKADARVIAATPMIGGGAKT